MRLGRCSQASHFGESESHIYAEHFAASSSTGEEENKRKLRIARLVAARRLVVYVSVSLVLRLFRRSASELLVQRLG